MTRTKFVGVIGVSGGELLVKLFTTMRELQILILLAEHRTQ